jgi:O-antigen/teichoic acid export membrane protein
LNPSRTSAEAKIDNAHTIQPALTLPFKQKIQIQSACLIPDIEDSISSLDTVPMFAIAPGESRWRQQQDIFINALVEDIALQATMRLPVIVFTPGKQTLSEQRQAIASTAGNAAIAGAGNLIFALMRYVTNIVMTNTVSMSIYGTYTTVYTSASILGPIAVLGLDITMLRFLSIYRAKSEHGLAGGLIRFVVRTTLISGLLCGALLYLSAASLAHLIYHQDAYAFPLKEVALLIPLISLQLALSSGLQALKVIKLKVLVDRLIQPVLTLVLIGLLYLLGLRLEGLILGTMCGYLASVIAGRLLLGKASKGLVYDATPKFEPKTWLRFALPMSFNSLIQNVMNSTDILFLAAFSTAAQVGLYAAADRASELVVMPILMLTTVFTPLIAEYYARGEYEQLASMSKLVTKWSFSLSLPVFLCFCVFHEPILSIFSQKYTQAGIALIILSFGNLVNAGTGSTGSLLTMAGHTRVILADTATAILVNIGLALVLVPRFNIVGAAISAALTVIILNIAYFIEVYWLLKIITLRWDMLKPLAAGGVASIVGLLLLHVIHVGYGFRAIFGTLGLVIPFMLAYVLVMALLRFSKEDRMVFDAVFARIRRKRHT